MRKLWIAVALTTPALLAGCIGGAPEEPAEVRMDERGFTQDDMDVTVGTEVGFQNQDDRRHTVTILGRNLSGNASQERVVFDEQVKPGMGQVFAFDQIGDYVVYCKYHGSAEEGERMTINVTPQRGGTTYDPSG